MRIVRTDPERNRSASLAVSRQHHDESARLGVATAKQDTVDAAVITYVQWRLACIAVRDAYRSWAQASVANGELAYRAHGAALDREQAAAEVYAKLMRDVGHLVESGLDYSLSATSSLPDAR